MIWGFSLHGWEDLMRFSLAVVGVFGLLVGLSTFFVVTLQREELAASKSEFEKYKKDSDVKIAAAETAGKLAQADAAKAVADTASARERTALLEKEAAQAKAEQERLKASMAWRRISPSQANTVAAVLRGHDITVWTSWVGADPESSVYRGDIDAMLKAAGVKTQYFSGWVTSVGLQIVEEPKETHDLLASAFLAADISFVSVPRTKMMDGLPGPLIIVGTKPPPF